MDHLPVNFDDTTVAFSDRSTAELRKAYWLFKLISNPFLTKLGISLIHWSLKNRLPIKGLIRQTIFRQFAGGENIEECRSSVVRLSLRNVGVILDYSVEAEKDETGFERTCKEILRTVTFANQHPNVPFAVFKITGLARFELLEKINKREPLLAGEAEEFGRAKNRVDRICKACYQARVKVLIDAEHSWIQDVIDDLALEMMMNYNQEKAIVYHTYQLYRHDKLASLKKDLHVAKENGFYLGAKLVRGAYMEMERERAAALGYPSPIHANKELTDQSFNEALKFCLKHLHHIRLMAATHNENSCQQVLAAMEPQLSPGDPAIYFAQLLGMSDHLSMNLAKSGYLVAKYMPYGPLPAVMPYLFRRAQENTSVAGQTVRELDLLHAELKRRKANETR